MEHPSCVRNDVVFQKGMSEEEVRHGYNGWMDYEQYMCEGTYNGPEYAAEAVKKYAPNKSVWILDVGAGTGRVGVHLKEQGFHNIDALEPSDLVQKAYEKNIYKNIIHAFFGWDLSSHEMVQKNSYDVVVSSGAYGNGHLKLDSLEETIRILRPGGLCVILMRENYLHECDEYRDRLEPHMASLVHEEKWMQLERSVRPNYFVNFNGLVFVFRKL